MLQRKSTGRFSKDRCLLNDLAERFIGFLKRFRYHFVNQTHDNNGKVKQYLSGLMQANRRNMERMEEVVPDSDEQALQHFISESGWEEREVIDHVAQQADELLGGEDDTCFLVDESGIAKKGDKSVGVARQWNGRLGKVDNSQVGVFGALGAGDRVTLIDVRLYLPKKWTEDRDRCLQAGVPEERIGYQSKQQLALEMVKRNRDLGLRFRWVGADGNYGKDPGFCRSLEDMEETFLVDVHKDQRMYLEDPKPRVPKGEEGKGRKPTRLKAQTEPTRVDKWVDAQSEESWQQVDLRESTKGTLRVEALHTRAWFWDGEEQQARKWHLVVSRKWTEGKREAKYSICNAPEQMPVDLLAYWQAQRFWIERALEDGKSDVGLADYQVRGWRGWHHHMALIMMAMLFMLEERVRNSDTHPLLSCSDIRTLLAQFLPRRDVTEEEVLRQLNVRHKKRQASIDSAYSKQHRNLPNPRDA